MTHFVEHLKPKDAKKLKKGDTIEYLDDLNNIAYSVKVVDKKQGQIKIHFIGWNKGWDRWIPYNKKSLFRLAKYGTGTEPNHIIPKHESSGTDTELEIDDNDEELPAYETLDTPQEGNETNTTKSKYGTLIDGVDADNGSDSDMKTRDVKGKTLDFGSPDVITSNDAINATSNARSYTFACGTFSCTNKGRNCYVLYHLIVDIVCLIIVCLSWSMERRYGYYDPIDGHDEKCKNLAHDIEQAGFDGFRFTIMIMIAFMFGICMIYFCIKQSDSGKEPKCKCYIDDCIVDCIGSCWGFAVFATLILNVIWTVTMIRLTVVLGHGMINDDCGGIQIECIFLFILMIIFPAPRFIAVALWFIATYCADIEWCK